MSVATVPGLAGTFLAMRGDAVTAQIPYRLLVEEAARYIGPSVSILSFGPLRCG